jgi:hypothetical protein
MNKVNWNTLIITAGFAVIGYFGKGVCEDVKATHDAVIIVKSDLGQMIHKSDFDLQMMQVRSRLSQVEADILALKRGEK